MKNTEKDFQFIKSCDEHVGHYVSLTQVAHHRFFIDKDIEASENYRDLIQILISASEHDCIELVISSNGGDLEAALNIVSAIRESEAFVRAVITGSCHSAASIICLACDEVAVLEYAHMMCHNATYGSYGKASDIINHVKFSDKFLSGVVNDIYKDFLTPSEIESMVSGVEHRFNAEEILQRLERRAELRQQEQERLLEEDVRKTLPKKDKG